MTFWLPPTPVGDDLVEVKVADTGSGNSSGNFLPTFSAVYNHQAARHGCRLVNLESIVENHGGRMLAEPNPGGGTVFRFTLQAVRKEEEAGNDF